jgi:hypothetical protein
MIAKLICLIRGHKFECYFKRIGYKGRIISKSKCERCGKEIIIAWETGIEGNENG